MCGTEAETALRILQIQRLRTLVKAALTCSGTLFICVGLISLLLHDRVLNAPSYRFIFGWSAVSWWYWLAWGWGVVFVTSGVLLVLAGTRYPEKLRQALALGTLLTCWWAAGLAVEAVWSQIVHRGDPPTMFPLISWTAWAVQFILLNQIPRVAPIAEDEWHIVDDAVISPTQDEVDRAKHGTIEP